MSTVNIECYLVVKATLSGNGNYSTGRPTVRVAKNKPRTEANEVPIKLSLQLPVGLFKRPSIVANITVPDDHAPAEITAEVQENIAKAIREQSGFDVRLVVESAGDD